MKYFVCFSCFITFDFCFFYLLTAKIIASCVTCATEKVLLFYSFFFRITLLFKILLLPIISLRFLLLLYASSGFSQNAFFSLGLICNKCQCLSNKPRVLLNFCRVLLNFSTSGILGLFAVFGFEVNKASLVASNILLNWKFSLQPRLIKESFNSSKCLSSSDVSEQIFFTEVLG